MTAIFAYIRIFVGFEATARILTCIVEAKPAWTWACNFSWLVFAVGHVPVTQKGDRIVGADLYCMLTVGTQCTLLHHTV